MWHMYILDIQSSSRRLVVLERLSLNCPATVTVLILEAESFPALVRLILHQFSSTTLIHLQIFDPVYVYVCDKCDIYLNILAHSRSVFFSAGFQLKGHLSFFCQ